MQAALRPANRVQLLRIAGGAQAEKFAKAEGEGGVLAVREGHIWGFLRKVRTAQNSPLGFAQHVQSLASLLFRRSAIGRR